MARFASVSSGGKGRGASRSRAEDAAYRRAAAWVERRRQERREAAQGVAGAVTKATDKRNLRATKAALVPTAG